MEESATGEKGEGGRTKLSLDEGSNRDSGIETNCSAPFDVKDTMRAYQEYWNCISLIWSWSARLPHNPVDTLFKHLARTLDNPRVVKDYSAPPFTALRR